MMRVLFSGELNATHVHLVVLTEHARELAWSASQVRTEHMSHQLSEVRFQTTQNSMELRLELRSSR